MCALLRVVPAHLQFSSAAFRPIRRACKLPVLQARSLRWLYTLTMHRHRLLGVISTCTPLTFSASKCWQVRRELFSGQVRWAEPSATSPISRIRANLRLVSTPATPSPRVARRASLGTHSSTSPSSRISSQSELCSTPTGRAAISTM